jgi:3-deoxy-D-manno-octulosonic-acid transferase
VRALYTVVLRLALPFILARLWLRGRKEPGYRQSVSERFGVYRGEKPEKLVWVHAVSVGEARAAAPLVRGLMARLPDHKVLVTCTTAAGRDTLQQVYGDSILSAYLPYDYPEAVQAFLAPFLAAARHPDGDRGLAQPARRLRRRAACRWCSPTRDSRRKSARGYLRFRSLAEPAFASLALVCAQSEADAARLRSVGARRVEVTGNLKFDVGPDAEKLAAGRAWRAALGPPGAAARQHAGERRGELLEQIPSDEKLLVVVVPRHPQRFDEVAPLAQSRRTQTALPAPGHRVHLGDTMGEMPFYYAACDVAVIGGSFEPLGGQNLIEALAAGAPVVLGPSMFNFAEATRLALEAGAAVQAGDAASAMKRAGGLLRDARERRHMSEAGRKLCQAHRGATERHLALIGAVMNGATVPARG